MTVTAIVVTRLLLSLLNKGPPVNSWVVMPRPSMRGCVKQRETTGGRTVGKVTAVPCWNLDRAFSWKSDDDDDDDDDTAVTATTTRTTTTRADQEDDLNLIVLDHYDSFTYNLVDMLGQVCSQKRNNNHRNRSNSNNNNNKPRVFAADVAQNWNEFLAIVDVVGVDGIVLSPGPGHAQDSICQLAASAIRENPSIPILGVCLGHQIMGLVYGATCVKAPIPIHGQVQPVQILSTLSDCPLLSNIPRLLENNNNNNNNNSHNDTFNVTRYHSWQVKWPDDDDDRLRQPLAIVPTAKSVDDDIVMALRHVHYPHYGVQFHPESIGSQPIGFEILNNFCDICLQHKQQHKQSDNNNNNNNNNNKDLMKYQKQWVSSMTIHGGDVNRKVNGQKCPNIDDDSVPLPLSTVSLSQSWPPKPTTEQSLSYQVYIHKVHDSAMQPVDALHALYPADDPYRFWLDSANYQEKWNHNNDEDSCASTTTTATSILGSLSNSRRVEYYGPEKPKNLQGLHIIVCTSNNDNHHQHHQRQFMPQADILQYLQSQHLSMSISNQVHMVTFQKDEEQQQQQQQQQDDDDTDTNKDDRSIGDDTNATATIPLASTLSEQKDASKSQQQQQQQQHLPFAFRGGHVGYLGYEVRHVTERYLAQQEHGKIKNMATTTTTTTTTTDTTVASSSSSELSHTDNHVANVNNEADNGLPLCSSRSRSRSNHDIPTAAFGFADQSLVYDHVQQDWYLIGVVVEGGGEEGKSKGDILDWMQSTANSLKTWKPEVGCRDYKSKTATADSNVVTNNNNGVSTLDTMHPFRPNRSPETYRRNFESCLQHICNGESYELCLTNQLEAIIVTKTKNPLDLYHVLRQKNPAPFSAFIDWNSRRSSRDKTTKAAVALCCSSPERFISVMPMAIQHNPNDDNSHNNNNNNNNNSHHNSQQEQLLFQVEAKPIKGTVARDLLDPAEDAKRALELQTSLKNRAENLMIVDLLRNDLSRVCQTGSVHVSKLMDIETFATVHQMVSTIRGTFQLSPIKWPQRRRDECKALAEEKDNVTPTRRAESHGDGDGSTVDVIMACFPGGSMTGAPKHRTMQLLHALEECVPRGPYSGALGYISVNGAIDLNKIIRTAVLTPFHHHTNNNNNSSNHHHQGQESWKVSVGAGGAITALSDNDDEYQEMILKAAPVMNAVQTWAKDGNENENKSSN